MIVSSGQENLNWVICKQFGRRVQVSQLAKVPLPVDYVGPPFTEENWPNQNPFMATFGEMTAGSCTTSAGAVLTFSRAPAGIALHYVAKMHTSSGFLGIDLGSGDVWHVTWHFLNSSGTEILSSPQIDLPHGDRMRPQYGDYNIDYNFVIPVTPVKINKMMNDIFNGRTVTNNSC